MYPKPRPKSNDFWPKGGRPVAADSISDADGPFISGALPLKPRHFALYASSMGMEDKAQSG